MDITNLHWHEFMELFIHDNTNVIRKKLLKGNENSYRFIKCKCCENLVEASILESFYPNDVILCEVCYIYYTTTLNKERN